MKNRKAVMLALLVLVVPELVHMARAATNYVGQVIQPVSESGAWTVHGSSVSVTNYNGQNLNTTVATALPTGTNNLGTVHGSSMSVTNYNGQNLNVSVAVALPTGTNSIGKAVLQTLDASGAVVTVGYTATGSSVPISMPTMTTASPTRVSATTSSGQLIAANGGRKGLECESLCTNTDRVFLSFGTASATSSMKPLEACASWSPPAGVNYVGAIQVLANSGTQAVHCTEY